MRVCINQDGLRVCVVLRPNLRAVESCQNHHEKLGGISSTLEMLQAPECATSPVVITSLLCAGGKHSCIVQLFQHPHAAPLSQSQIVERVHAASLSAESIKLLLSCGMFATSLHHRLEQFTMKHMVPVTAAACSRNTATWPIAGAA